MISWDTDLRTTSMLSESVDKIKQALNDKKPVTLLSYVITFPTNSNNILDIYNTAELMFRVYRNSNSDIHIIGLAQSKSAAIDLACEILSEVNRETRGFDVKGYFTGRVAAHD